MKKKAFTLMEILIVIFVFGVGILAVLNVLTRSLSYFDSISIKTKASFLAQEGIEIAYSFRDSNIEKGFPWNYVYVEGATDEHYLGGNGYSIFKIGYSNEDDKYYAFDPVADDISLEIKDGDKEYTENFDNLFSTFYLKQRTDDNNIVYYYYPSEEEEIDSENGFARVIYFSPIGGLGENSDNKIMKITSLVLYKRGGTKGDVILESFIGMKDSIAAVR